VAVRRILTYPDPALRLRCPPVDRFDEELRRLASDLIETMHAAPGVGLAAPQIGRSERLAVVDLSVGQDPAALHVLVNPQVAEAAGSVVDAEGCLSLPGWSERVERPATVRVVAVDLDDRPLEVRADGLLARALCHEIDHLDGILFVDRLRGLRRERARRHLRRLAREEEAWAAAPARR
jgi:peptide deformylase